MNNDTCSACKLRACLAPEGDWLGNNVAITHKTLRSKINRLDTIKLANYLRMDTSTNNRVLDVTQVFEHAIIIRVHNT